VTGQRCPKRGWPATRARRRADFGVGVDTIAYLAAFGSVATGTIQLAYAKLTRVAARRRLLAAGSFVVGAGFAAQALAPTFAAFALTSIVARLGGSPQHPVGNALLAEQFPERRRGFAISAHITGGNVGTVVVALAGAWAISTFDWRGAVVLFGLPGVLVALAILAFVRESGEDRAAAVAEGSVRAALGAVARDRDHRWIFLASIIGGGGRGLGVVNLFALVYLTAVVGVEQGTADLMYGVFIALSVPAPLVAGWLSDRFGRKPLIVGVYLGSAVGFAAFLLWAPGSWACGWRSSSWARSASPRVRNSRPSSPTSRRRACATRRSRSTSPCRSASARCGPPSTAW
jgi:MFS family permease